MRLLVAQNLFSIQTKKIMASNRVEHFHQTSGDWDNYDPSDWKDLVYLLENIRKRKPPAIISAREDALSYFSKGVAFITFGYGIDGVTIEIAKYAETLSALFLPVRTPSIHMIGGDFQPQVSSIFRPEWHQFQLDGIDGWSKWDGGKWFHALFNKNMISFQSQSNILTKEIYRQAVEIAKQLGKYFIDHEINLVIPVNVVSNPGNMALTLGLVLVTETLGICVLNSNHDFYWESGKPRSERELGEKPGVRDHFFRNIMNKTFFSLLKMLFPWNGDRWLQININARQSNRLITKFGFPREKVFEISTSIADSFFDAFNKEDVQKIRRKMAHILSNGEEILRPVFIEDHLSMVDSWMGDQQPVILGAQPRLSIDPTSNDLIILLQPTRIVRRKRIERDIDLIDGLFRKSVLREEFQNNPNRQLILHITGPVPKEHQKDLEKVLLSYKKMISSLPPSLGNRIFLAFSVGHMTHPSFSGNKFQPLTIESLYRMADAVVFPSETEGRGLPIIEASAVGIPIICSQYQPIKVFRDVIGEKLPQELRIRYTLFPEGKLHQTFLSDVSKLLVHSSIKQNDNAHNQAAVHARFSQSSFRGKFEDFLNQLANLGRE